MKKISIIAILSAFIMPALAEEVETKVVEQTESDVVAQYEQQFEQPEIKDEETPSNPKTRFPHGMQLGLGVSPTSGLNMFIGYNNKNFDSFWAKRFGVRFDFASYSPIKHKLNKKINNQIGDEGVKIDDGLKIDNFKLDAKHYGAMVDFYPFGNTWFLGGLRLSGGYFSGKLDLNADVHGIAKDGEIEFELNKHKYYYIGDEMHAKTKINWNYSGPYLGTGFDLGLFWGFKIYMDAGVVFADNVAKLDMNVPLDGLVNENHVAIVEGSAEHNQFLEDKKQTLEDARKEVKDYPYYPLIKLGFMYRF